MSTRTYRQEYYAELKASGLCPNCKGAPEEGYVTCRACIAKIMTSPGQAREIQNQRIAKRRKRLIAAGLCTRCGVNRAAFTGVKRDSWACAECNKERSARNRASYQREKSRYKLARSRNECVACGAPAEVLPSGEVSARCAPCLRKNAAAVSARWADRHPERTIAKRRTAGDWRELVDRVQAVATGTLTAKEIAAQLGVKRDAVYRALRHGG